MLIAGKGRGLAHRNRKPQGSGGVTGPRFANMPAMNAALNATGRAFLGGPGDSTRFGYGATAISSIVNCIDNNETHSLKTRLIALGFNASDDCYSFGNHSYGGGFEVCYNGRMVIGSGYSNFGFQTPYGDPYGGTTVGQSTWTPQLAYDRMQVFYRLNSGFGDLVFDQGGSSQTIHCNNASDGLGFTELSWPLSSATMKMNVTGGFVLPIGLRFYNSTMSNLIIIDNMGQGGADTAFWLTTGSPCNPFDALPNMRLDGHMVNLGLNDKGNSVAVATFQANLQTIINKIKTGTSPGSGLACDVAVEIPNNANPADAHELDSTWITAINNAATNTSVRTPLSLRILTYPGDFSDTICHPNSTGYGKLGVAEANWL